MTAERLPSNAVLPNSASLGSESFYEGLARLEREGRAFVVCSVISTAGSTPQKPGAKLAVADDGALIGTIGGGAVEQQVVTAALALLGGAETTTRTLETHLTHDLGMCCGGQMTVFLEKHPAFAELVLFGAGHVAREVAKLASTVGFRVTVADEREAWATAERFPGAVLRHESPVDAARALVGGGQTFACVATHDHSLDQACVEALLRKPLAYLGVIGSRRKADRFRLRLRQAGFADHEVGRLECPMGLSIAALTPAEIGVSIVARLIAVRRKA